MTEGTSQGLFIVVAIVIFGIFVSLSYTLFGKTLQPQIVNLFETATNEVSIKPKEFESVLLVSHKDNLLQNSGLYGFSKETITEGSSNYTRIKLNKNSNQNILSLYSTMANVNEDMSYWNGKDVEFSVTFKSDNVGSDMKYLYSVRNIGQEGRKLLGKAKVTGKWQTLKVVVPDFKYNLDNAWVDKGYLILQMDDFGFNEHVDISNLSIRTSVEDLVKK